ncbi:MAG: ABC transporter ATP-binding protein, partial [Mycobacteriales bacterium]
AGFAGALLFVVADLAAGRASVGDLTLAVVLAQALNANLGAVIEMINWLVASLAVGARLVWLDDLAAAEPRGTEPAPVRLAHGLSFEHVTFRYPGTDRAVLSDVSIELPAGGVVAIVGENGAGKTTLAKLLTGMYDPSAGRIRVDDRDLAELDPSQWRRRCTGAFQDHARFELPLREAVGIGDVVRPSDDRVVLAALDAAGATDLVERLPAGLDTRLGAGWGGGADLSGGQWQKVALARAFIRTGPLLTVLDEPTAALDAATEDALFARYAAAASDARARGGVTLLISHRFSTVRMADVIVVLEHGRVVERGSHGELMRAGGAYAELYSLQARGYR